MGVSSRYKDTIFAVKFQNSFNVFTGFRLFSDLPAETIR
jgi:hypothetical protein